MKRVAEPILDLYPDFPMYAWGQIAIGLKRWNHQHNYIVVLNACQEQEAHRLPFRCLKWAPRPPAAWRRGSKSLPKNNSEFACLTGLALTSRFVDPLDGVEN